MSAEVFPTEILMHIFRCLNGRNLIRCRRVCTRWRDIIHEYYKQDYWHDQCAQEFRATYMRCYVSAKLSWRELFNSLALWDDLGGSAVKLQHVHTVPDVRDCRFLKDGILGYRLQEGRFSKTVAYCDIHTFEPVSELHMGNRIQKYDENENLIVYEFQAHQGYCIRAICKLDTGKIADEYIYAPSQWWLQGNNVYYMRKDERSGMQHLSRIAIEWDMRYGVNIYVEVLAAWRGTIDELIEENGRLVILQEVFQVKPRICGMNVIFFRMADGVRKYVRFMGVVDIDEFWIFGYAWTEPRLLRRVKRMLPNDPRLKKHDVYSALNYGKFLLVTTSDTPGSIKIFDDPYEDGSLVLDKREAVAVLDLSSVIGYTTTKVTLLHVIEVYCGHRIMVLCGGNLVIMDLVHVEEAMYGDKHLDAQPEVLNEDTNVSSKSDTSADTLSSSLTQSPMESPEEPIDVRSEFTSVASSIQEVIALTHTPEQVELEDIPEESEPEPVPEEPSTSGVAFDPSTCKLEQSPSETPTPKEATKRPPGSPEAEHPPSKASRSSTLPSFTEDPLEGSSSQPRKQFQEDAYENKDRSKTYRRLSERSLPDSSSDICDSLPFNRPWLSCPKPKGLKTYKGPSSSTSLLEQANTQQNLETRTKTPSETFKRPWLPSPTTQDLKTYKGPSAKKEKPSTSRERIDSGASCSIPSSLPPPRWCQEDRQEASVSRAPPSLRADEGGFSYSHPLYALLSVVQSLLEARTLRPEDEGASTSRGGIGILPPADEGAPIQDSPIDLSLPSKKPPEEIKCKKDSRKERYKKSVTKDVSDK